MNKKKMLTKNTILEVLKTKKSLLATYGVNNIGLFGSFVGNNQKSDSDIDILVDFKSSEETFDNLMSIYDVLEKSFKNNKVDIVTKNGLSKHIGSYILKETEYA
ncbi:MAG: nucleotidyltransferase family protein [Cyclobacteriaceae bacterium]|nr:nucleotidyltransferase family protein [Cyclobacteriaceae bacterium]